jgi:hypothetical protein
MSPRTAVSVFGATAGVCAPTPIQPSRHVNSAAKDDALRTHGFTKGGNCISYSRIGPASGAIGGIQAVCNEILALIEVFVKMKDFATRHVTVSSGMKSSTAAFAESQGLSAGSADLLCELCGRTLQDLLLQNEIFDCMQEWRLKNY